jgi:hypothetical protein
MTFVVLKGGRSLEHAIRPGIRSPLVAANLSAKRVPKLVNELKTRRLPFDKNSDGALSAGEFQTLEEASNYIHASDTMTWLRGCDHLQRLQFDAGVRRSVCRARQRLVDPRLIRSTMMQPWRYFTALPCERPAANRSRLRRVHGACLTFKVPSKAGGPKVLGMFASDALSFSRQRLHDVVQADSHVACT